MMDRKTKIAFMNCLIKNSLFIVIDGDCKKKYRNIFRVPSHAAMQTMEYS